MSVQQRDGGLMWERPKHHDVVRWWCRFCEGSEAPPERKFKVADLAFREWDAHRKSAEHSARAVIEGLARS